jgi:hypothetical protein
MRSALLALVVALALHFSSPLLLHTAANSTTVDPSRAEPEDVSLRLAQQASALTSFDLDLSVQNATDLGGFEFDIVYNRATAQITGITPRNFFGQSVQCNSSATRCAAGLGPFHKSDRSRVGAYSYGSAAGATGSDLLAVIHVQTSTSPAALTFAIANALVVDSQGNPITQNVTLQLNRSSGAQIFLPMIKR